MKHLKKFNEATIPNAFLKQKIDHRLLNEFFAELIDDGAHPESNEYYFEIFINIPDIRQYKKDKTIFDYVNISEESLNVLKDVEVAIKRIYDKFGIYPEIDEEDEGNSWYLHLCYGDLNQDDLANDWEDYDDEEIEDEEGTENEIRRLRNLRNLRDRDENEDEDIGDYWEDEDEEETEN